MLLAGALIAADGASAQNAASEADRRVQDLITRQKDQTDLRDKRCRLSSRASDEIVVCGALDPEADRLPLREEDEPGAGGDGRPRAPDVGGAGIFTGAPTISGLCVLPPCPGEAIYYIDLDSLPADPPGSDAERIGRGETLRP